MTEPVTRRTPLRVLHLVGSAVSDFYADLSLLYARDCLEATADPAAYDVVLAVVSPGGGWRFPRSLAEADVRAADVLPVELAVTYLVGLGLDLVVPQMFCVPGMTTYRSLFDLLGVPCVGNRAEVMALGADKARARAVVAAAGVAVPEGELVQRGGSATLATPSVVKPVDADNSLGVALARTPEDYPALLAEAFRHSDAVLVERYVELGREVRCGIVERGDNLVCLPLEEYAVDPTTKPIRGYADKIARADDGDLSLVAKTVDKAWIVDPADPVTGAVWEAARRAHVALGARHYSLFDFRIDPEGMPWFLEAGLYCSFARTSVVSVMAAAAGIGVPELFATTVERALSGAPSPTR